MVNNTDYEDVTGCQNDLHSDRIWLVKSNVIQNLSTSSMFVVCSPLAWTNLCPVWSYIEEYSQYAW